MTNLTVFLAVLSGASGIAAICVLLEKMFHASHLFSNYLSRKRLGSRLAQEGYTEADLIRHTRLYVQPSIQDIDPAQAEEIRQSIVTREPAFKCIDRLLTQSWRYPFLIVLGDSGMGKSALLVNFAARHWRRRPRRQRFAVKLFSLAASGVDERIKQIAAVDRPSIVLLLDAFDEDPLARLNHKARLASLIEITEHFRSVVISARTQFFDRDEELPDATGRITQGPTVSGQPKEILFHKMYLSPFDEIQIEAFLRRKYKPWMSERRRLAKFAISKAPDLAARPLVLSYIDDLLDHNVPTRYVSELYELIIAKWISRERPRPADSKALRQFCDVLACRLMAHKATHGKDRIAVSELRDITGATGLSQDEWRDKWRSLLNRDAVGNFKFAHRSILEYLYARAMIDSVVPSETASWTDMVSLFATELLCAGNPVPLDFRGAQLMPSLLVNSAPMDLRSVDLRGVKGIGKSDLGKAWLGRWIDAPTLGRHAELLHLSLLDWADDNKVSVYMWMKNRSSMTPRQYRSSPLSSTVSVRGSAVLQSVRMIASARTRLRSLNDAGQVSTEYLICGAFGAVAETLEVIQDETEGAWLARASKAVFARYDQEPKSVFRDGAIAEWTTRLTMTSAGPLSRAESR